VVEKLKKMDPRYPDLSSDQREALQTAKKVLENEKK